jgi:hypothetical protein
MAAPQQQQMKCINPQCGKEFVVFTPHPEVVNTMTLSMVVWVHPDVQPCPHCGTPYQMTVQSIRGVTAAWRPVKTQGAAIAVPPPGFKLPDFKQ